MFPLLTDGEFARYRAESGGRRSFNTVALPLPPSVECFEPNHHRFFVGTSPNLERFGDGGEVQQQQQHFLHLPNILDQKRLRLIGRCRAAISIN